MENVAEALKIVLAAMIFILALSLSVSSFSQASSTVNEIINMRDRETEYTYVEPAENLTRTVGIESVVSTIYRATTGNEEIEIHFVDNSGNQIPLYYDIQEDGTLIEVTSIDSKNITSKDKADQKDFLDIILGGEDVLNKKNQTTINKYKNVIKYTDGLYEEFKNAEFEELLGEYSQDNNKTVKRVITYKRVR